MLLQALLTGMPQSHEAPQAAQELCPHAGRRRLASNCSPVCALCHPTWPWYTMRPLGWTRSKLP